jgi:hypothetical protein
MTATTRRALHVIAAGAALGVLGDLLLPAEPWGLNLFLWVTALVAAGAWLARRHALPVTADGPWLGLTALLLAAAVLRRDARLLQVLDVVALIGVLSLATLAMRGVQVRLRQVGDYVAAVVRTWIESYVGGLRLVLGDVAWRELPLHGRLAPVRGLALGAVIAAPVLLLFVGLFASADQVFERAVDSVMRVNVLADMAPHVIRTGIVGALAAGYLRELVLGGERRAWPFPALARPGALLATPAERATPVATAVWLVNALFAAFVLVQLRYLFGGAARIEEIAGLTYAEYARRGFFELCWVSGLMLPLLLGAERAVRGAPAAGLRRVLIGARVSLGLLAVIMTSALERMRLYVGAYGLTEDRLYATAGMVFLAVLFAWLAWTALRGRPERFAFGATVQGLAVLAGLHVLNPDAVIVRHNLARPGAERPFDVRYAASLSADAAPALAAALPQLSPADACVAAERLAHWAAGETDWRTWNWSRARARTLGSDPVVQQTLAACPDAPTSPLTPDT